jgi:hypothetical protein
MKRYVREFANDLLKSIPDTDKNRSIRGRIKTAVQLYECGHITALEAVFTISNAMQLN